MACIHACHKIPCHQKYSLPGSDAAREVRHLLLRRRKGQRCGHASPFRSLCCVLRLPLLLRQLCLLLATRARLPEAACLGMQVTQQPLPLLSQLLQPLCSSPTSASRRDTSIAR